MRAPIRKPDCLSALWESTIASLDMEAYWPGSTYYCAWDELHRLAEECYRTTRGRITA